MGNFILRVLRHHVGDGRTRMSLASLLFIGTFLLNQPSVTGEDAFLAMSYNIRYQNTRDGEDVWPNRKAAVCETLRSADVVGLQEVVAEQFRDIQAACPDKEWYGVGRDDGAEQGEATPIGWNKRRFSLVDKGTFWLSPTPKQVGSQGWDAALPRIASWVRLSDKTDSREILFLNTHFDHRGAEARVQSAKLLRSWISEREDSLPVILSGDFNATAGSAPIQALLQTGDQAAHSLRNAREASPSKDVGPNSTWNGFRKIQPDRRIDFLFINERLNVDRFETLDPRTSAGRFASDHLPVTAVIRLN